MTLKNTLILHFLWKIWFKIYKNKHLKSLALWKSECLGPDPKLFTCQVGSGSKTRRKMGSGSEKNSFGSTTLQNGLSIVTILLIFNDKICLCSYTMCTWYLWGKKLLILEIRYQQRDEGQWITQAIICSTSTRPNLLATHNKGLKPFLIAKGSIDTALLLPSVADLDPVLFYPLDPG
jgi:hypothetical protein